MHSVLNRLAMILIGAAIVPLSTGGLRGESLAELARKEKERRKKSSIKAPVYGENALAGQRIRRESERVSSKATPTPAAERDAIRSEDSPDDTTSARKSKEAYWRERAQRARDAVAKAEQALEKAEQNAARTLTAQLGAPSSPGCHLTGMETYAEVKEKCTRSINPARAAHTKSLSEVERAKKRLDAARQALVDLRDEARRAGALPGWLR